MILHGTFYPVEIPFSKFHRYFLLYTELIEPGIFVLDPNEFNLDSLLTTIRNARPNDGILVHLSDFLIPLLGPDFFKRYFPLSSVSLEEIA